MWCWYRTAHMLLSCFPLSRYFQLISSGSWIKTWSTLSLVRFKTVIQTLYISLQKFDCRHVWGILVKTLFSRYRWGHQVANVMIFHIQVITEWPIVLHKLMELKTMPTSGHFKVIFAKLGLIEPNQTITPFCAMIDIWKWIVMKTKLIIGNCLSPYVLVWQ